MIMLYFICFIFYTIACYCLIQGNFYENEHRYVYDAKYDNDSLNKRQLKDLYYGIAFSIFGALIIFGIWALSIIDK